MATANLTTQRAIQIEAPRLLLVEGWDEKGFFDQYLRWLQVTDVQVVPYGGKSNKARFLREVQKVPEFRRVRSIILLHDADQSSDDSFASVCDALGKAEFPVPQAPLVEVQSDRLSVVAAIIPPFQQTGDLESLLLQSVGDDVAISCVEAFVACLATLRKTPVDHEAKRRMQAFLATRKEVYRRLGDAALDGIWPFAHSVFEPLRRLLVGSPEDVGATD